MKMLDVPQWLFNIITILTPLFAAFGWWRNHRQVKKSASAAADSAKAADRSAAASERSAAAAEHSVAEIQKANEIASQALDHQRQNSKPKCRAIASWTGRLDPGSPPLSFRFGNDTEGSVVLSHITIQHSGASTSLKIVPEPPIVYAKQAQIFASEWHHGFIEMLAGLEKIFVHTREGDLFEAIPDRDLLNKIAELKRDIKW